MKKLTAMLSLVILLTLVLTACGGGQEAPAAEPASDAAPADSGEVQPASEIVVFNWSEYIDPEIYAMFEEETGIKIVEDNFSNNEEMLAKLQGGAAGYAVIIPSDYTVGIMIEEGMLAELDHANIPNLENLSDQFKNVPFDPGNKHCAA